MAASAAPDATMGTFWSLEVRSSELSDKRLPEAGNAEDYVQLQPSKPAALADWTTTQGLGLYVSSTLLLSVQAASAKALGTCALCTSLNT